VRSIADYGVGNYSSAGAGNCGAIYQRKWKLPRRIAYSSGVGAFDRTMGAAACRELVKRLEDGVPCLGICIGAQILFESSEEGKQPGLGFYQGKVIRLKAERVPHMGWNSVRTDDSIFQGIRSPFFYFAHSYYGMPSEDIAIGSTDYFGQVPTLFLKNRTYGTQFHPEKSSESGMLFLRNFVRFAEGSR
jgi:glutamine amidotransferase